MNKQRVIVGMSGGVDSSVAALLLLQQGYHVEGLFMKNWDEDDGSHYCTAKADFQDAKQVCKTLNIELHSANFAAEYWDNVFQHFLAEYRAGRTPNPDVLCNREIKFKVFLEYAQLLGANLIATGHYARVKNAKGNTYLIKGHDIYKDQSYFLHAVGETEFKQTLFPLGELTKSEVRNIAEQHHLITHDKKDSTGICFIGERRFKTFLQGYLPAQRGDIVTTSGETIGEHSGLMYHTIGQRQGLGIGGLKEASGEPWYVVEKNMQYNQLVVAQGKNHPDLFHRGLIAEQTHWINRPPETQSLQCQAKVRYRQKDQHCCLTLLENAKLKVIFDQPQRAVTPGQSIVFYIGDHCIGGAVIESRFNV